MKNRGFTLIELLAVIVIISALALIVIPIVSDSIDKTKNSASTRTIELYMQAVDEALLNRKMTTNVSVADGCYNIGSKGNICLDNSCTSELLIDAKNKIDSGTICIEDNAVTRAEYNNQVYLSNND